MEHLVYLTVRSEVTKFIPAYSEDRPDWGSENFPADVEFNVYLGDIDITKEMPVSELEAIRDRLLEDYN